MSNTNNSNETVTFEMNGTGYETDLEVLDILRAIVPEAKAADDFSAVQLVFYLGLETGRIKEL